MFPETASSCTGESRVVPRTPRRSPPDGAPCGTGSSTRRISGFTTGGTARSRTIWRQGRTPSRFPRTHGTTRPATPWPGTATHVRTERAVWPPPARADSACHPWSEQRTFWAAGHVDPGNAKNPR
ncbi:hypothetical protein FF041_37985 [Streptomyces jumonjinensis]|uniref:Uncharacterized protein n=1 Tax=Streptomyces jumonjinensis TaxID=1945 RepID=A0A646KU99_STRJU|nr:hypothetical protein [Streptomyces jumonjinensis]